MQSVPLLPRPDENSGETYWQSRRIRKVQILAESNHIINVASTDDSAESRSPKLLVDVDQDSLSITLHTLDV